MSDNTENKEFRIRKVLNSPVDVVWKAWTNPEYIAQWWGPAGFTNTIQVMDVVPGGEWRLIMHGPDGKDYPNRSVFLEILPEKKIVFEHFNPNYTATVTFQPQEAQTLMEWKAVFETEELFKTVIKVFKADEGMKQNVEKLENFLQRLLTIEKVKG